MEVSEFRVRYSAVGEGENAVAGGGENAADDGVVLLGGKDSSAREEYAGDDCYNTEEVEC